MSSANPWKKHAVEGIVIVVSILLAFAIDAWWDTEQSQSREQELLNRLQIGFENHIRQSELAIESAADSLQAIRSFITSPIADLADLRPESRYETFDYLIRPRGLLQGLLDSRSILATLDTDRFSISSEVSLLAALAEWQGELETLEERNADVLATAKETLEVLANYPEAQQVLATPFEERSISLALLQEIKSDNEVMAILAVRGNYVSMQLVFLNRVNDRAKRALEMIRENMNNPG